MGECWQLVEAMTGASAEGRWDDFANCLAIDVTAWSPSYDLQGRAAFVDAVQAQNRTFDDVRIRNRLVAESDVVVAFEWTWSVAHPSGAGRIDLNGMSAYEISDGVISNIRQYWDNASFGKAVQAERGG
jgi:ketosteroid isomerase-like protein